MSNDQVGKYIRLMCLAHQKGGYLTKEDMFKICNEDDKDVLSKFEKDGNDIYYNERLLSEIVKRKKYSDSRRNNRKGKTEEKEEDMSIICESYEPHMENENINISIDDSIKELYKGVEIFFDEDCRPKTEKQKHEWYDTLDKLIRIDGYTPEQIHNVIKRARMDDFWRTNFLSVLKLRKKNREGISYFTVFEKKLYNGTKKDTGADTYELAKLTASKLGAQR